ncbi:MAG: cbb3-type cytochrome oxidase assembly protein CcoS [Acidobacteria bacterium]|nr:MAG: cbb3-type cytochrome oxidase assembly protein CcoS [Acidobacteriota bacterium]
MSVLYVVFPLALAIAAVAVVAFVWAVRSGQFDDLETPAMRILDEDDAGRDGERPKDGSPPGTPR